MILIIDDEKDILEVMREGLIAKGFARVFDTIDATEALDIIREKKIRVCFVDIGLKKINGIDLIKDINQTFPDVLVVAFSGLIDLYEKELDHLNIVERLGKPFKIEDIIYVAKKCFALDVESSQNKADTHFRKYPRFEPDISNPIKVHLIHDKFQGDFIVESISLKGVGIHLDGSIGQIQTTDSIDLHLYFPHLDKPLRAKGDIRNINLETKVLGIGFTDIDDTFRDSFKSFMRKNI